MLLPVIEKPLQSMVTFCAVTLKQVPAEDWLNVSVHTLLGTSRRPQLQGVLAHIAPDALPVLLKPSRYCTP